MNLCGALSSSLDSFAPKPSCISPSSNRLLIRNDRRPKFLFLGRFQYATTLRISICKASSSNSSSNPPQLENDSSQQLFESLKEVEKERMNKLEEFERKANVQLERQLMMASEWSRALLTMKGKLKGTEWDPVTSHSIDFSDFKRLLDSNNVRFMEYSNYGQTVSGFLHHGICYANPIFFHLLEWTMMHFKLYYARIALLGVSNFGDGKTV